MSDLKRVMELANLLVVQSRRVEQAKAELARQEQELRKIENEDLPELMREIGMLSVTLDNGMIVEVADEISCGITEEHRQQAHTWLIENGFGGLIKTEVVMSFGRGERDAAEKASEEIQRLHLGDPIVSEKVHAQTLKAFIKEQLADGVAVPFDLFSVHPYSKAKLKASKK